MSTPSPASTSTSSPHDESHARELLSQVRYLLDDERAFANKLIDDRKTKLSLVAVVIGLGLFKIDTIAKLLENMAHAPALRLSLVLSLFAGLLLLVVAVWLLALERDPISRWANQIFAATAAALAALLCKLAGKTMAEPQDNEFDPRERFGAALVVLFGDRQETDSMGPELEWLTLRIEEHRWAYLRLTERNRRVRKRLETGTMALLLAFGSVIVGVGSVAGAALQRSPQSADTTHQEVPNGQRE